MKISLITPSYNSVSFIKQTIGSVLSQEGDFTIEWIFCDSNSKDGTWDIISQLAESNKKENLQVKAYQEKDSGMYDGINKGLAKITGDVWGYLNADDILMPGALHAVAGYFNADQDLKMLYGQGLYMDANGKFFGLYPSHDLKDKPLLDECYVSQPSAFMRKEVYAELGGFNSLIKNSGDYEYWLRIQNSGMKMQFVPNVLSATRIHGDTKTSQNREIIKMEVFAITSYYNKGKVPKNWQAEFTKENWIVSRIFGLAHRFFYKAQRKMSEKFSWLATFRKNQQIKEAKNKYFN